jgi:hypothetical protein
MGILDKAVDISDLGQRKLVVLYGKSNSGKTETGSTWPKPMLYVALGDDGSNTIAGKQGIKALPVTGIDSLKEALTDLVKAKGAGYASVFVDTFSLATNVWIDKNVVQKKKKMTQQLWGDLKTEEEELIRLAHELAHHCWVILSCHESTDAIEGMEDEILPDVRPSVTKGARTYLEGMANYGLHCTRVTKTVMQGEEEVEVVKYAAHIGPNPFYWTKLQIAKDRKVPKLIINPSYDKLMKVVEGGSKEE